jgi:hypothetical protein
VDLGIPHVVTVTCDRVLDQASLQFTEAFYSGLFWGKSVTASFQLGLARLVAQFPSERDKFLLLGGGDHQDCLFGTRAAPLTRPHLYTADSDKPLSQCDASAMFSLGRLVPVQEVCQWVGQWVDIYIEHMLVSVFLFYVCIRYGIIVSFHPFIYSSIPLPIHLSTNTIGIRSAAERCQAHQPDWAQGHRQV